MPFRSFLTLMLWGVGAALTLFAAYLTILSFVSGWVFAIDQLSSFRYFIFALTVGFGIQVGLYLFLKEKMRNNAVSGGVVATTGATSAGAMISCCTHYLVNIFPILGVTGIATLVGQYQIELFWVGIFANGIGIFILLRRINGITHYISYEGK